MGEEYGSVVVLGNLFSGGSPGTKKEDLYPMFRSTGFRVRLGRKVAVGDYVVTSDVRLCWGR